ncbi:unnamed protein product [Agarophyton chilense]|eukprot:gb/GEZJ01002364.1/.p1 GENE.gb/GEZJ01002364.1/~~gb/GEZJ01002364.1/.p1  ORF type:complete len:144 (-),score=19.53 gb/GEZJ01002364.1/:217-648(-)
MYGIVINLALILLAAKTHSKGRRERSRVARLEAEAEEKAREWSSLNDEFQFCCRKVQATLGEKEEAWAVQVNRARERATTIGLSLGEEVQLLQDELASLRQLGLETALERVEELEDQRFEIRNQNAMREARIVELRNAVEGRG